VATTTGGEYYAATDAKELTDTLLNLPDTIALQHRRIEVSVWFALAGAMLALAAVVLAQWWSRPRLAGS
jgi:Ca-activated chloride channel family protein